MFSGEYNFYTNEVKKNHAIDGDQECIYTQNGYQQVSPINISKTSDWTLYPFILGNGSKSNPYIIENVEIIGDRVKTVESGNDTLLDISSVGIYINAGGSFIIRNTKISHTSIGILLSVGISPGVYPISNIEIGECSIGIYSRWQHVNVSISDCYIHDCNWVSIKAKIDLNYYLDYGGIGLWIRSDGGGITDCRIEDCSIGMVAGLIKKNYNNKFINCGFVPDYTYAYITTYNESNTVNGKPIGIFFGINNLNLTNASLYGQLIFLSCSNLTLSNVHITKPCSIGIQLFSSSYFNQTNRLNNIIIENQKLGMYVFGGNVIGDNLYVKNCEAGFYFNDLEDSEFIKIMIDNTDIPIYMIGQSINNLTIELERLTKLYFVNYYATYTDLLEINLGNDVSMRYINELGILGYSVQFDSFGTYHLNLTTPASHFTQNIFTIVSVPRNIRPDIYVNVKEFPFIWIWSITLLVLVIVIELSFKFYLKVDFFSKKQK